MRIWGRFADAPLAHAAPTTHLILVGELIMNRTTCAHLDQVHDVNPGTPNGCAECLATGGRWVHLRMCLTCGHVGCCDQSPGKHATAHYRQSSHAVMRSHEPGEDWGWCYADELFIQPAPRASSPHS
jgi:hypothetical protein